MLTGALKRRRLKVSKPEYGSKARQKPITALFACVSMPLVRDTKLLKNVSMTSMPLVSMSGFKLRKNVLFARKQLGLKSDNIKIFE